MEFSQKSVKGVLVFEIKGQIRISTQGECKEHFNRLMQENNSKTAVLDMSGVGYMNSAGIGMVVECFKKFKENGGRVALCGLTPDITKLFEVTKLDRYIEIYRDQEEAVRMLTS